MEISVLIKEIEHLVLPIEDAKESLNEVFHKKLQEFGTIDRFPLLPAFADHVTFKESHWWIYICLLQQKLLELKSEMASANEKDKLVGVNQQKHIKSALEMIVTLGILYHLPPGVGFGLKERSKIDNKNHLLSADAQKISSLSLITSTLMELKKEEYFNSLILQHHLGDLLAGLFSLLLPSVWSEAVPLEYKNSSKVYIEELIEKTPQILLIKELMLIFGTKECPVKLRRAVKGILTERLLQEGGVRATIKAVTDMGKDFSPSQWKTTELLGKLLTTPHIKDIDKYRKCVFPQILPLLYMDDVKIVEVAAMCIRNIYESDPEICRQYFFNPIMLPFKSATTEIELSASLDALHNCLCIVSSHYSVPPSEFSEIHTALYRLFCKTNKAVTYIKNKLTEVVWTIIINSDSYEVYNKFVFTASEVKFSYGGEGGVKTEIGVKEEAFWEDASEILLHFIISKGINEVTVNFFHCLLDSVVEDILEKKLVSAKLLSELCNEPSVQESLQENPSKIIKFIKCVLNGSYDDEISCLGLMVLGAIINDPQFIKKRNWEPFKILAEPLILFKKKCKNLEIRVLADEIYTTILTHGATNKQCLPQTNIKNENFDSKLYTCEIALKDACHSLMPVRAHGIRQLGKLILKKDKEALTKKDIILCIFKENLKDDDSYVYLAAIEGLAAIASSFPDEVLITLCEQYIASKTPNSKLKVGETLVKVIRLLNEMAVVYKKELANAFLTGCRSEDYLVRASSLSNLGELCKILSFRISNLLPEIFYCIECIAATDKFVEPRRAAVLVLRSLLVGLSTHVFSVLENELLELYRKLKIMYNVEKDDVTRLHVQLAIEELNVCTKSFLRSPEKLEKHIFVLDGPK